MTFHQTSTVAKNRSWNVDVSVAGSLEILDITIGSWMLDVVGFPLPLPLLALLHWNLHPTVLTQPFESQYKR